MTLIDGEMSEAEPEIDPAASPSSQWGPPRGICRICGEPAYKGSSTYCNDHKPVNSGGAAKRRAKSGEPRRPAGVTINLTQGKASKDQLAEVEARAKQLAGGVAAILVMTGNTADAGPIVAGTDVWARSVAELARYEPWLRKLAAGGQSADRVVAWIGFLSATAAIAVPIAAAHNWLPPEMVRAFGAAVAAEMPQRQFDPESGEPRAPADVAG